ncbi:MAG: ThuA domain-containing protein [Spirochaetales bacterium]|nr:ThuA domain-containing protein [Spirochaetales bacterium]
MVSYNVLVMGGDETGYHDFKVLGPVFEGFLTAAGFSITLSEDPDLFLPENIKIFDVIVCYMNKTKITKKQEQGLLQSIIGSPWGSTGRPKGFVGIHIACCSFEESQAYHKMLGCRLLAHPKMGERYRFKINNPRHPVVAGLKDFSLIEELYLLELYPPFETLMTCDFQGFTRPITWIKPYGMGRVFYTSLGHSTEQLTNEYFQKMVINAVNWSAAER